MAKSSPIKWNKVDRLLLIAALAPTPNGRKDAFSRISAAYSVSSMTLIKRLHWLGFKHPPVEKGFAALLEWDQEMRGIIGTHRARVQLYHALEMRRRAYRTEIDADRTRSVTFKHAAKLLGVHVSELRGWVLDLELIERDKDGLLPLPRVRAFFDTHWWFIKAHRYWKRSDYWKKEKRK